MVLVAITGASGVDLAVILLRQLKKNGLITELVITKTAEKIIEIAKKNNIYIHNDPDLIEVLSQLDINDEISPDLYIVAAELLAFVYSLNSVHP